MSINPSDVILHRPAPTDGILVSKLVEQSPPLDTNSIYCNLLQCTHFADTAVAAKLGNDLIGFVSGYLLPEKTDTLFIWQVAVSESARGIGLASAMIKHILTRSCCQHIKFIETTITKNNDASWALFKRIARQHDASITETPMFEKNQHFQGRHDTEFLVRIGPLNHSGQNNINTKLEKATHENI